MNKSVLRSGRKPSERRTVARQLKNLSRPKGNQVNIPELESGAVAKSSDRYSSGNANNPADANTRTGKSCLFYLTGRYPRVR